MCGIVGICKRQGNIDQAELISALDSISHRGPDDEGFFIRENVGFAHRRLSIVGLPKEEGHQPMVSQDGNYILIYNGEIYNHLELRKGLIKKGCIFHGMCDTETLLKGLMIYGTEIIKDLNGIFSFAYYDKLSGEIIVARDLFGTKPLYYSFSESHFYFASELKALIRLGSWNRALDLKAINNYLAFLWSPGERTPFLNVHKLLPGHFLRFNLSEFSLRVEQYTKIVYHEDKPSTRTEEQLVEELDSRLTESVSRQLMSDVPIGFFLSGGIDSSLIVAIAQKINRGNPIRAFTINSGNMEGEGFVNDLGYARTLAKALHVELYEVNAKIDILSDFDKMIWHLDEPQADPSALSVLRICEYAKTMGIKVLLGGTGADELFSGYRRHQALYYYKLMSKIPGACISILRQGINMLDSEKPIYRRIRKLINDFNKSPDEVIAGYFLWIAQTRLIKLFSPENQLILNNYDPIEYFLDELKKLPEGTTTINKSLFLETRGYLPDHNLNYLDKMSMAVGIECRVPYLDADLSAFSCSIPSSMKLKGLTTKYILRKLAARYLPKEIINRPKTGFSSPVRKWIKNEMHDYVNDHLSCERISKYKIFNPIEINQLIIDNKEGKIDASYTIWGLLAMHSWFDQFL